MACKLILLTLAINLIFSAPSKAQTIDSTLLSDVQSKPVHRTVANEPTYIEYFFYVQTGMLVGCNDCGKTKDYTFTVATVHGVTIGKKLRAGAGLGFDTYENWQTLPLFGIVSWDLIGNKTKNALFVQMAYGWAHPWFVRDGFYASYASDPFSGVSGGKMINPQIGYRLKYYNLKISMVVGYKFQQITYRKPNYYYPNCPMCDLPQLSFDEITQDMNRVQLLISVGWK
jgi:hypothetical protein